MLKVCFHLQIGQGEALAGVYAEILWYGESKNLKVEIDIGEGLVDFENKPIVFTPHAFHRDITATGFMTVDGDSYFESDFELDGSLLLNNTLEVANEAATDLTGNLEVDGATSLNNDMLVANGVTTHLDGALSVGGFTYLNNALNVTNSSATALDGDLNVARNAAFNDNLTVTQASVIDSIQTQTLQVQSDQANFVGQYENLNGGESDGIVIKLGRTHGAWDGSNYLSSANPINNFIDPSLSVLRGWLNGGEIDLFELYQALPSNVRLEAFIAIRNKQHEMLNDALGLPIAMPRGTIPSQTILPELEVFPGLRGCTPQACFRICFFGGCRRFCVPPWRVCADIPRLAIPEVVLPSITLPPNVFGNTLVPELPEIPSSNLFDFTIPTFSTTTVPNSLTSENQYLTFADKDGRVAGAVKAQSTRDFRDNTILDDVYVLNILSDFIGIDPVDGFVSGTVAITNLVDEYNRIGVEYSSGNGDYAEWLERADANEYITSGDIVAVKGGKITKDLTKAEQLMVVSHQPIVMGNAPEEGKAYLGNNVAFIGQVPVKVIGSVQSGDYIIADSKISGYGRAIHPEQMRSKDHSLAVGRSWEDYPNEGPKMVNTVVGLQNGDWMNSTNKLEKKQKQLDSKIKGLEAELNRIALKLEIATPQKRNYVNHR